MQDFSKFKSLNPNHNFSFLEYDAEKEFYKKTGAKLVGVTSLICFDPPINLDNVFMMLPVPKTEIKIPTPKRRGRIPKNPKNIPKEKPIANPKKIVLPHCSPGTIISMSYKGQKRGVVKSSKKVNFKNGIYADMSLDSKNVNLGIYPSKINVTGIKDLKMIEETAIRILGHFEALERICKKMSGPQRNHVREILDFLKKETKGESSSSLEIIEREHDNWIHYEYLILENSEIKIPKFESVPKHFDLEIYLFFLGFSLDFDTYEPFIEKCEYIYENIKTIFLDKTGEFIIKKVHTANIKCNFSIGFIIRKDELNVIHKPPNLLVTDDPFKKNASIEIIYEPQPWFDKKPNKVYAHKFTVTSTGTISLSSSSYSLMLKPFFKVQKKLNEYKLILQDN